MSVKCDRCGGDSCLEFGSVIHDGRLISAQYWDEDKDEIKEIDRDLGDVCEVCSAKQMIEWLKAFLESTV